VRFVDEIIKSQSQLIFPAQFSTVFAFAFDFLPVYEKEFQGRGISYSAYCDASFYKNKKVAVVGGGNSALENAEYLSRFAKEITLINHRNHFSAEKILINKAFQNSKINYLWNSYVRGFRIRTGA
jgi:thioredoxin reductase (NADPH)